MSRISKELNYLISENSDNKNNEINSFRGKGADRNPLYLSNQTKLNKTYLQYTLPSHTTNNEKLTLLIPRNTYKNGTTKAAKIRNEINKINKKAGVTTEKADKSNLNNPLKFYENSVSYGDKKFESKGYMNRPILKLDSSGLNFKPYCTIGLNSPTKKNVTGKGIYDSFKKERNDLFSNSKPMNIFNLDKFDENKSVKNFFTQKSKEENQEFLKYINDMNNIKQRKINQWKQEFLEDNLKY
jgi:hypothetical protein